MGKTVTICFTNNKGGSGKSTTCSNLGAAMARAGKKVLLVDGDMQLNLSLAFFPEDWVLEHAQGENNLYYAIGKQADLTDYIVHTPYENLDLVPSSTLMSSIEYELFTKWQREFILRKCLQKIKDSEVYDYILIDAPPTLGGWVMNILCASDKVIIPVEASPWGMFGLANMFEFLNEVKQISPELEVAGIAVTKVDTRKNYFKQTMETLHELESIYVFEHVIRVDSSVEWSQDNSVPVVEYKKSSRSAKEYMELAEEVMNRVSRERQHPACSKCRCKNNRSKSRSKNGRRSKSSGKSRGSESTGSKESSCKENRSQKDNNCEKNNNHKEDNDKKENCEDIRSHTTEF